VGDVRIGYLVGEDLVVGRPGHAHVRNLRS
jgi:hypothetical protein